MSNKDIEILQKKLYDYCVSVFWKKEKLDEMAANLKIDKVQLRQLIKKYARKHLNSDEYEKINEILNNMRLQDIEYNKLTLLKVNPILYEFNGKTINQLWETEEEKEFVLKYIYDYCVEHHFILNKIRDFAAFVGIPTTSRVENYAKKYAIEYLGYNIDRWRDFKKQHSIIGMKEFYKSRENHSKKIYENLLEAETLESIINIIEDSGLSINTLSTNIVNYVVVHKGGDDELIRILKSKFKLYSDYVSQQKKETILREKSAVEAIQKSIQIPIAINIVKQFIEDNDSYSTSIFCQKNNIDRKEFDDYILLVKEVDENLFYLCKSKIENNQKRRYAIITNKIEVIVKYLKTGVEEYGIIRPFDLIDYYKETNFSFQDFLKLSKSSVSQSDYRLLKRFFDQNSSGIVNTPSIIPQIMSEKVVINYQKDKKGMPIPGTEEVFSNEEKEKLINYLKQNKIPINLKTYGIVFRRYRCGILDLDSVVKLKHK